MDDLFDESENRRRWPTASDRPRPLVFLRELALLDTIEPPKFIRRVEFHAGLNIVWADPKVEEARRGGVRLAGHSAGKTTLCRIVRWLLGESHFGTEDLEAAVGSAFLKGWALLHVELDGQSWVIARAFAEKKDHRAVRALTLDAALTSGLPEQNAKAEFFADLTKLTLGSLVRRRFPGAESDIGWTELLGWLARDQEAALQRVEAWRSTVSGGSPNKENRHVLMRLVLELLDDPEWREMEACAKLETEKDGWQKKRTDLEASARAACEPLQRIVGKGAESLAGPLLIDSAAKIVAATQARLDELKGKFAALELKKAEDEFLAAVSALAKEEKAVESTQRRVKRLEKRVGERNAERIAAKASGLAQARQMPPGFCARKREEVAGQCPLYVEVTESVSAAEAIVGIERQRDQLQEELDDETHELADVQARLPFLNERESQLREQHNALVSQREALLAQIANLAAALNADHSVVVPAKQKQTAFDLCESEIKRLAADIKTSKERQRAMRDARWRDRNDFADFFRGALHHLLGPQTTGHIEFDSDGLFHLVAKSREKLSSAAIEALKVIAFDLGAMLWSASGRGHHPRFLIHDSPRVADMSPVPYGAIFDLAASAERDASGTPNFQYIITTTEPPPDELREKHLILTLDASREEGRLFRRDF